MAPIEVDLALSLRSEGDHRIILVVPSDDLTRAITSELQNTTSLTGTDA